MKGELEKQARFFHLGEHYFWLGAQNTLVERRLPPQLDSLVAQAAPRRLRILDLGCGPGNTIRRFMPVGNVYGFDYSLDALALARTKGITNVFSGVSAALPIASGVFDCVVAVDVLEHVEDDAQLLCEIVRVLRPGGLFFFTVPAFMALWRYHDEAYGPFSTLSQARSCPPRSRGGARGRLLPVLQMRLLSSALGAGGARAPRPDTLAGQLLCGPRLAQRGCGSGPDRGAPHHLQGGGRRGHRRNAARLAQKNLDRARQGPLHAEPGAARRRGPASISR